MFDPAVWAKVPFHFWSTMSFVFGCCIGSFLNVCIYRMPIGQSVVSPPSHCPHCKYSIPWYLNMPLVTWLVLRGRCANCRAPISPRYFLVELLTGVVFLVTWLCFGGYSVPLVLALWVVLSGFLVATFIDFEHFIIPDEITYGGVFAGFICSFLVPTLQHTDKSLVALQRSLLGIVVGGGVLYGVLRIGKLFFGRQNLKFPGEARLNFTETSVRIEGAGPDFPSEILYEDLFYRKSDAVVFEGRNIVLPDRTYEAARVRLTVDQLRIGDDVYDPEKVSRLEASTSQIVLPREAMGLGDVKFMAAIGAFLGWQATLFSLFVSSMIGALAGIVLIVFRRKDLSSRIPYGPYIALAATLWIFGGSEWLGRYLAALAGN